MAKLHVTYAGHLSDRVQDLYFGQVPAEGIELHFIPLSPAEAFRRLAQGEFQVGEMSFSTYIVQVARGDQPFVAIPVFPSRAFRHSAIYVHRRAGIGAPRDLIGRRVGVPEYQMTAALWVRGALQHQFSIAPADLRWVTGGLQDPGRQPLVALEVPGVSIVHVNDASLDTLLLAGEIDAIIAPQMPPSFRAGHPDVIRLFPNYPEVEREYFRLTGVFPIMHTVVLQKAFYEQFPWVAVSLFQAFEVAKQRCLDRLRIDEPLPVSLPWIQHEVRAVQALMGEDFWPYGVEENRKAIETACQYAYEQGLCPRLVSIEELFAPNVTHLRRSTLL